MKKWIWTGLLALTLIAGWMIPPVQAQLKYAALSMAQTFTALQTFNGGVGVQGATTYLNDGTAVLLPMKIDFTMDNPTVAPTFVEAGIGTCTNAGGQTYKFAIVESNQSGETMMSPASGVYTPSSTIKTATITRPAIDSRATHWRPIYAKGLEGFSTWRTCNSTALYIAAGTSTAPCNCFSSGAIFTNTNTTGTISMMDSRDGELRFTAGTPSVSNPILSVGANRLYTGGAGFQASFDSGVTRLDLMAGGPQTRLVCKSGCFYSTIQSAVNSITDATATKRYTAYVMPGDYAETVTMKSYVSLVGADKMSTRILGSGDVDAVKIPADITEVGITNLTLGESGVVADGANTVPMTVYVWDCLLGIVDGTGGVQGDSQDCIYISNKVKVFSFGNLCRSTFDGITVGPNSTYVGEGNAFELDNKSNDFQMRVWRTGGTGAQIYEHGSRVSVLSTTNNQPIEGLSLTSAFNPETATQGYQFSIRDTDIEIRTTNASRTNTTTCFNLPAFALTNSNASLADFSGSNCRMIASGSSVPLVGLGIASDADFSNWTVRWNGGWISMSGGASRTDVNNADTAIVPILTGVEHSGTYSGAGAVTGGDVRVGGFTTRLLGRVGDLAAATCTGNEIALDNGGANKEICICDGGAWACATVTTATGPTN